MKIALRGLLAQDKEAGSAHRRNYVRVLLTLHCVNKTARRLHFMPVGSIHKAAVSGRVLSGPRRGQQATRIGDLNSDHGREEKSSPRCVNVDGVGLHANTVIPPHDRMRLERMLRYMCRPPIALERLKLLSDGRLLYRLKKQWRDGTSHIIFQPHELMERLVALVPAPRFNMILKTAVRNGCQTYVPVL